MSLNKTCLYDEHVKLGGKMVPFAGWDMPVQYVGVKDEVMSVRQKVGMFDVSHMGEFFVEGPDAVKFVDYMMCNDFAGAGPNKAVYSPLCREDGTVVDDHISYKVREDFVLICVNASNMQKDWEWFNKHVSKFNCKLTNKSDDFSLIALQGPLAEETLKKAGLLPEGDFPYYSVREHKWNGESLIVTRTGYTGEDGVELFCSHTMVKKMWAKFLELGVTPCGLASRDVLRLEVCFPLYGHELNDELTPLDAALKWTVKLTKPDFIGKAALTTYQPRFQLVKLLVNGAVPRDGYTVVNEAGEPIGKVSSGTHSVVLNKGIAEALIDITKMPKDKKFAINIRNKNYEAIYQTKAFVTGGHK